MVQKSGKFKSFSYIFEVHSSNMISFLFTEVDYLPDCVLLRLILKLTDTPFSGTRCIVRVVWSQTGVRQASEESQPEMKNQPRMIHRAQSEQEIIKS